MSAAPTGLSGNARLVVDSLAAGTDAKASTRNTSRGHSIPAFSRSAVICPGCTACPATCKLNKDT